MTRSSKTPPPPPPPPPPPASTSNAVALPPPPPRPPSQQLAGDETFASQRSLPPRSTPQHPVSSSSTTTPVISRRTTLEDHTPRYNGNLETPISSIRRRITTPHKFVFLSDQKTVPSGLKRLYESTLQRRQAMIDRVHDLNCELGQLDVKFAQESMDMGMALRDTLERSVCIPLEASVDRLVLARDSAEERGPAILSLEGKLADLDLEMTRHSFVTINDMKREHLDYLEHDFLQNVLPRLRMETAKTEKVEGGVLRRFDSASETIVEQLEQEADERRASVELVRHQCEEFAARETKRDDDILQQIRELRHKVKREREVRRRDDKVILDDIRRTTIAMKRALLAAVGGP